jgi:hypothetical protein
VSKSAQPANDRGGLRNWIIGDTLSRRFHNGDGDGTGSHPLAAWYTDPYPSPDVGPRLATLTRRGSIPPGLAESHSVSRSWQSPLIAAGR